MHHGRYNCTSRMLLGRGARVSCAPSSTMVYRVRCVKHMCAGFLRTTIRQTATDLLNRRARVSCSTTRGKLAEHARAGILTSTLNHTVSNELCQKNHRYHQHQPPHKHQHNTLLNNVYIFLRVYVFMDVEQTVHHGSLTEGSSDPHHCYHENVFYRGLVGSCVPL